MASCQKYFSIISDSSQTHTMCLLQVSHWRSRSHRLSQKEMNEPSQLSHFLEAHKKNEPQPHCYGEEERGVCREKWFCCCRCLGGRESFFGKHVFSRHGEAVYLVSCYHCHLQAKLPDGPAWTSRHSCFQHSPLLFPQFSGNLWSPQNTCTIFTFDSQTGGKGTLDPSWSTLIQTYLLTRKSGIWSSPESTTAWVDLFERSTPTEHP